jgi:glycyl-tRNA synthetase
MAFIVKKKIKNKNYYYLNETRREGKKVISKCIGYLGKNKKDAENKKRQILKAREANRIIMEDKKKIEMNYEKTMDFSSRRSLFYPSAEIYSNSPKGFWDFGPVGGSIRRKIIDFWRNEFVKKENMLEIDGSQILPISVFEGSGHLKSFADPVVICTKCKKNERADKLLSDKLGRIIPESASVEELNRLIKENKINCLHCQGSFGEVNKSSLMVESIVGRGDKKTYLRPEACQSIFLNFARMVKTMRLKLPQGIAQAGGAFRNEISPRQSITRCIEFKQMEAEVFFDPDKINEIENFDEVKDYKLRILLLGKDKIEEFSAQELVDNKIVQGKLIAYFLAKTQIMWNKLGIPLENMRFREVDKDERAFYSLLTLDFEVLTSIGWLELIANNYRTDYDLKGHMEHSKSNLFYSCESGEKIIPHIWEISAGVDRTMFAVLENSFRENKEGLYLSLNPLIAPYDCAVFPLAKEENLLKISKEIIKNFQDSWFDIFYDQSGSIGKRYARQDEIGTPYCITIDKDSLKNNDVTIRDRDTTKQKRVKISELKNLIKKLIFGEISFENI